MPKKESIIGNPLSPYAVSKLSDELYAGVFALNYNMQVIGLRYFNVFGPRQNPAGAYAAAIPLFMDAMTSAKQIVVYGDGLQTRDFTFVENAVQANIRSFFAPDVSCGLVYNVATGRNVSVIDLFNQLKELFQSKASPEYLPERQGEVKNSLADINLAKEKLNYEPTVHLAEGLKHTVNWFTSFRDVLKA
jgi:UDP-N-acetylglucosamine 4-epimerase